MTHHFEQLLHARCCENPDVGVLRAQWGLDRELLSTALQSVAQTFPHYSRHDASHSRAILVQVERFLGHDGTTRLSATDLWLLLEAAYYHDIGMIVTNDELEELWREPAFRTYLERLRNHVDPDLADAARRLIPEKPASDSPRDDSPAPAVASNWPLQILRAVRVVVAEYKRVDHATRSSDVVRAPQKIGLASPRTGLIPDRLIGVLGRICAAHGGSFENVMSLPFQEAGVASDKAHPRLLACLLRLGDLLDLDNGRFCPVMLATFGNLPRSSQAHVIKHASITHLRVDPELIEVEAECPSDDTDLDGYEVCAAWIEMLRQELQQQQEQWTQVAPSGFRPLPARGKMEVRLSKMASLGRMAVDSDRVTKILQGANIYDSPTAYVRELLQNAVDATMLRVWFDHRDEIEQADRNEDLAAAQKLLAQYPIDVRLERVSTESANDKRAWRLIVIDQGIGIRNRDVDHIRRVGSSAANSKKKEMIDAMPQWFRPSGIFGIGLQSLFLITPEVRIDSRSAITGERLRIRMLRGRQVLRPSILSQPDSEPTGSPTGTTVECDVEMDRVPRRVSRSFGGDGLVEFVVGNYDPIVDKDLPYHAAQIETQLREYAEGSWVPIRFNTETLPQLLADEKDWFWDRETSIRVHLKPGERGTSRNQLRFRGVEVSGERLYGYNPPFFVFIADILGGKTDEIIKVSREKLCESTADRTREQISGAIYRALQKLLEKRRLDRAESEEVAQVSASLLSWTPQKDSEIAGGEWKELKVDSTGKTLGDIAQYESVLLTTIPHQGHMPIELNIHTDSGEIRIRGDQNEFWFKFLCNILPGAGFHHRQLVDIGQLAVGFERIAEVDGARPRIVRFSKMRIGSVVPTDPVLGDLLRQSAISSMNFGCRRTIPCPEQFRTLELESQESIPWPARIEPEFEPRMLLPFAIQHDDAIRIKAAAEVVFYVVKHSAHKCTRAEVAQSCADFVRHADEVMRDDPRWQRNKQYEVEDAAHEFLREASV